LNVKLKILQSLGGLFDGLAPPPLLYYILLAAIGAVSSVFATYTHPGGQA